MRAALEQVRSFWESHVNNEYYTQAERGTSAYFEQIERRRYAFHYHLPELFARIAALQPRGKRLLEVGSGIGIDGMQLARLGFDEVVGLDLTESAVEIANARAASIGLHNARFQVGNAESLPFPDGAFDVVYSFGVIHHTPNTEGAARELFRVLKPGGRAFVMIYHSRSLVGLIHEALRLPYESPRTLRDHCPVTRRFTRDEARRLFDSADEISVHADYPFTYGMRAVSRFVPRRVERLLGRAVGWHLMVEAVKRSPR